MSYLPCENPQCKSYGKPHPNCRCHGGMAHGGTVERFCASMRPHQAGCEYFAAGGEVESKTEHTDNPQLTLGHAAVNHGLLGLFKDVGRSKLADADRHISVFEDAKTQHSEHKEPKGEVFKKTLGNRLGTHINENDHAEMAERLHGHTLVGGAGKGHLEPILQRLAPEMIEQPAHPDAFRGSVDYLHSSARGHSRLKNSMGQMIGGGKHDVSFDSKKSAELRAHLEEIEKDPSKLIDAGGHLGHYLPEHGTALAALVATASDYLKTLKPQQTQSHPLDEVSPVDKLAQAKYDRALDVASQPLVVTQHIKDGTLLPTDVVTLKTIYPGLYKSMVEQVGERLITAASKGEEIPYKQKQSLSLFIGQPLDATQTPQAMQAIIKSAGPQQAAKQSQSKKPTSEAALKQINKSDSLYALPLERREINRKS